MLLRNDKQPITGSVERGTRSPHGLKELAYVDEEMRNRLQVRLITRTLAFHVG